MYQEQIDEFTSLWFIELEKKADARLEYTKSLVLLKTMASKFSILKNTASVENKINSLLCLDDEVGETAQMHYNRMCLKETEFKNARDMIEYYRTLVIEYQSRRKSEREIR